MEKRAAWPPLGQRPQMKAVIRRRPALINGSPAGSWRWGSSTGACNGVESQDQTSISRGTRLPRAEGGRIVIHEPWREASALRQTDRFF